MIGYRMLIAAVLAAFLTGPTYAGDFEPLDQIINFAELSPAYRSLLDPTTNANVAAFDAVAMQDSGARLAPGLNQNRARHILRARRFVKIPAGMTAADVGRAWRNAGGNPQIREALPNSVYAQAQDAAHLVTDSYIATGFVCDVAEQPGAQLVEIWARHFLFVTSEGGLIAVEPPECP